MAPAFEAMGFECRVYPNPVERAGSILLATRIEVEALPTVLGYGHGDTVRGMEERWTRGDGPWKTAREGDRLYGRGTADNKGQHTINMAALGAVLETRGRLGFNTKFMIETGEENGSAGVHDVARVNRDAFAADAIQPLARAHCQLRYIAGTDVENVVPALRRHLDEHGIEDVQVLPPPPDNAAGFSASRTDLDDPWAARVLRSIERTTGRKPAIIPQMGGSICNDVFTDILGLPSIWIPHSYTA